MTYQEILYQAEEGVLTITLNRPHKLNAFTRLMLAEMIDAFDRADADDSIRAIVVTGAGRAFCAGADLSAGGDTFNAATNAATRENADTREHGPAELHRDGGGLLTLRIFDCKKPVIAAINGPAVGIGITMTLAMDIRLASDLARIGFVFSRRGIVPEACSSYFLPRIVGISQALEWTYSGRIFNAEEAHRGGLVRSLHPADALLPAATRLAQEFATDTSPLSIALIRNMMWKMLGADHPMEAHKIDSRGIYALGRSAETREGVESFLQKRRPEFPGKVSQDMPQFYPWWQRREFE